MPASCTWGSAAMRALGLAAALRGCERTLACGPAVLCPAVHVPHLDASVAAVLRQRLCSGSNALCVPLVR